MFLIRLVLFWRPLYKTVMDSSPVREPGDAMRRLGDHELLEEIATGGMGIVSRARQVSLNRIVALKMIRDSQLATTNAVKRIWCRFSSSANWRASSC